MYTEVGAFDAKAKLSQLLQEVKRGRRYTITLRGQPVADLIPSEEMVYQDINQVVKNMLSINKVLGVSNEDMANWITEGRK